MYAKLLKNDDPEVKVQNILSLIKRADIPDTRKVHHA